MRWTLSLLPMLVGVAAAHAQGITPVPFPTGLSVAALAESVAVRLDARAAAGQLEGVLLIARLDGTVLARRAWGLADRATGRRNADDTRFALASMGKMFTATAIAQLVDAGRVALDSPLVRYLPDYPNAEFARRATVRMLLNHTSGLGVYWGPAYDRTRRQLLTPADHLPLILAESLPFAPGTGWQYSNSGFQVLGLIIERVSGLSFYEYLRRQVFTPAGMTRSGFYEPDGAAPEGTAIGYTRRPDGALGANDDQREIRGGPAGGGLSTAPDLLRFFQALHTGRLMRPATLAEFTRGQADNNRYALGFFARGQGRSRFFGHNGGFPGMLTWGLVWPEQEVVAILLTNRDPGSIGGTWQDLIAAMGR